MIILVLAFVNNWIYRKYFWINDLHKYDAHVLIDLWDCQDTADIIYLGESSNFSINPNDTQRLSISSLLNLQLKDRVAALNKGAYHAGIYYDLIKNFESPSIKTVIVTLNLRTLNQATIHAPIETALQKQARMFKPYPPLLNRLLLSLNAYDDKSLAERDKEMWYEWTYDTLRSTEVVFPFPTIKSWCEAPKFVDANGVEDMAKRSLADHYIKAYAFQIDTLTNPRIKQLDAIVQLCKERDYKLVFNFLAENTEYADSLVGPELVYLMRENRDILADRYVKQAVLFVDNLELVAGKHYTDQDWTTEHYDQIGRQQIADHIVELMQAD